MLKHLFQLAETTINLVLNSLIFMDDPRIAKIVESGRMITWLKTTVKLML